MKQLPVFRGYTVDVRLRQFRKVTGHQAKWPGIEFVDFDSPKGRKLLKAYEQTLCLVCGRGAAQGAPSRGA